MPGIVTQTPKQLLRETFANRAQANLLNASPEFFTVELDQLLGTTQKLNVACFFPHQHEPNLSDWYRNLIHNGHRLAFPIFDLKQHSFGCRWISDFDHDFAPGEFGILAPAHTCPLLSDAERISVIDYWIVPGLLFDHFGGRLGRGKGIYDRLLAQTKGIKVGVAFQWQVVSHIPRDPWDVPMDFVVTDVCSTEILSH